MFTMLRNTEFVMDTNLFTGDTWVHLATFGRARPNREPKFYVCFRSKTKGTVYIEELTNTNKFIRIEDDSEWNDAHAWLKMLGVLRMGIGEEKVIET